MGRLTKARLAAKARATARKNGCPTQSSGSSSESNSLPEIAAVTSTNENPLPSIEEELEVHVIPNVTHPENQAEVARVSDDPQQPVEAVPRDQNPRRTGKMPKCCDAGEPTSKKRQPRCSPFDLWSDEVQRQMAAADAKPRIGSVYKMLLKKWSRLPRIQKNYWKHRARLVNETGKKKKVGSEREKKEGRNVKAKVRVAKTKEKTGETMELMVEMLPTVKQEEDTSSNTQQEQVVLVYSAYTLWLLNFRRSVSSEFSDQLGAGSKLAARLWEGLSMKEKVAWNNRAVQVNGILRYGWERASTYSAVRKFVLGEKKVAEAGQLTVANVQSLAEQVVVKREPVPIQPDTVGCIKLFCDSLGIVGEFLKDCESPDVASSITWLVGSLHSSLEPLSALAHGMNISALQCNVEQLRKFFHQQKL